MGCGNIAKTAHLPAFEFLSNARIGMLVDTSEKAAKSLAKKYRIEEVQSDYSVILDRNDIDFAIVTVPPSYHAAIAVELMKSGKHVLIEKPLASSVEDAREIVRVAERTGVVAGVVHNRRFYQPVLAARKSAMSGSLGDVYQADFASMVSGPSVGYPASDWHFDKKVSGGGVIIDQGIHTVDLIRWLLGEVRSVFGTVTEVLEDLPVDVGATVLLQTVNGTNCTMELSWLNDFTLCPFTLWGTAGTLFVEPMFGYCEEVHGPRNPAARWWNMTQTLMRFAHQFAFVKGSPTHRLLIQDFLRSIETGRKPIADVHDGFKAVEIVDAIYRSVKQGEKVNV